MRDEDAVGTEEVVAGLTMLLVVVTVFPLWLLWLEDSSVVLLRVVEERAMVEFVDFVEAFVVGIVAAVLVLLWMGVCTASSLEEELVYTPPA